MALEERPVYRSLNEPLTIMGYNLPELVVTFLVFYYSMAIKALGIVVALVAVTACAILLKYAKSKDPRYFYLFLHRKRFRPALDAARRSRRPW